ncbi:MAG TPA: FAD-binding oxidoreductase [Caldimonas sp.]
MDRRQLLQRLAASSLLSGLGLSLPPGSKATRAPMQRVRPGDPGWPSPDCWATLGRAVEGRLVAVRSPLADCVAQAPSARCDAFFKSMKNPYFLGDEVGLTQTLGWVGAWTSAPSPYAVACKTIADIVAAVNFAREHNLRLVVKGGGHSYLGTSCAADSLLVWTRAMNDVRLHDSFVGEGCSGRVAAQPAVSVGGGAIWAHAYDAVTTKGGRYVQGGGCVTVGVAGLVQGGCFGSFSKRYGMAAASLLEAEVVTADGAVRIANACTNPDLYWALKGGGGGSFGVVTRMTLRTHELPAFFGVVSMTIHAASDDAFQSLVGRFLSFYRESLFNPHWGEIVNVKPGRRLDIAMVFQGLDQAQAEATWAPFLGWVKSVGVELAFTSAPTIIAAPARVWWDPAILRVYAPEHVRFDDRPGASPDNFYWPGNAAEAGHVLYGFTSTWLPARLLERDRHDALVAALTAAAAHATVEIHLQKGLAGAPAEATAAAGETAMNAQVLDAFALAIVASEGQPAYPGVPNHEPDLDTARSSAQRIHAATKELRKVLAAAAAGSYVAESDFFEPDWQQAYWGQNYERLRVVKAKFDPTGLFFVHHGVGSEEWSADGFSKLAA